MTWQVHLHLSADHFPTALSHIALYGQTKHSNAGGLYAADYTVAEQLSRVELRFIRIFAATQKPPLVVDFSAYGHSRVRGCSRSDRETL